MQELLARFNPRELRVLLAGAGLIALAALATSALLPQVRALAAARGEVDVLLAASVDADQLEQDLLEQDRRVEEIRFRLYGDMADLPVKQVEAYIIGRLQEISWGTGVELLSVKPAAGEQVQIFEEMLFNVELLGEYNDLYRWLWDVRNELGYVVIKEYKLTRRDNSDVAPILLASLSLASYRAVQ